MSQYGKRVPLAFLLVGLLAALSRWHHGKWELFSDTASYTNIIDQISLEVVLSDLCTWLSILQRTREQYHS